jgi:16S rRNA processing protein RimM
LYLLAKIVKTRGNKGEVVCTSPDLLWEDVLPGTKVLLQRTAFGREAVIEAVRFVGGRPVVKFKGVDTINEAYGLIGCELFYERSPESLEENSEDLDLSGYTLLDQHGATVGVIEEVLARTMQPLLQVSRMGQECLIPWVEEWLLDINEENRTLVMTLPDGLIDIN